MEEPLERRGFGPTMVVGATLATFFFPFFALIGALLWLGSESDLDRRSFLRKWAWWSAAWLVVPLVLLVVLASTRF